MTILKIAPYSLPNTLPSSRAPWRPEADRAVLLIHDMQRYFAGFFDPGQDPLRTAVHNMERLRAACADAGVPVVFTGQPATVAPGERGLLGDVWGAGLASQPDRAGFLEELQPGGSDLVLQKQRYSAFWGTELAHLLSERRRDQLWICGVYAHIGCLATAYDGFMGDIKPFLVADALADFSRADHERALATAASCCGVVLTTDQLCAAVADARTDTSTNTSTDIWTVLRGELADLLELKRDAIQPEAELRELGLDSVRALELSERLRDRSIELDDLDLMECITVSDLRSALRPLSHRSPLPRP